MRSPTSARFSDHARVSMVFRPSAIRASSLSDFGSSIEYGFVAGGFGVGLRWGWFLPDRGGLPVLRRVAAWAG